jgi:DNA-binding NtrC family response regulator
MVDPVETPVQDSTESRLVVLIVEDEFLLRWPASEYLRDLGYRVIEAGSVSEAMVVFSSNTRVDAVFSDINLQGELNGHALARWLDKHYPTVPMLLTSGDKAAAASVSTGATRSFISKPYSLADVDQRIKALVPRHV